jgi:hypothetical protein
MKLARVMQAKNIAHLLALSVELARDYDGHMGYEKKNLILGVGDIGNLLAC